MRNNVPVAEFMYSKSSKIATVLPWNLRSMTFRIFLEFYCLFFVCVNVHYLYAKTYDCTSYNIEVTAKSNISKDQPSELLTIWLKLDGLTFLVYKHTHAKIIN